MPTSLYLTAHNRPNGLDYLIDLVLPASDVQAYLTAIDRGQ